MVSRLDFMKSIKKLPAPTREEQQFHRVGLDCAKQSIDNAVQNNILIERDATLIEDFTMELRAAKEISIIRVMKITTTLVSWRRYLKTPFAESTINDLYRGIEAMKAARPHGKPYKQNTRRDFILILKQFYRWLIANRHSAIPNTKINEIIAPRSDSMTKTVEQLLTPQEVEAMITVCLNSRDRAMIAVLYEGGFRAKEIGVMSWNQIAFDEHGVKINVNLKTEKPRYIRLVAATQYLLAWRNDYPFDPSGEALVFLSRQNKPLKYATMLAHCRKIAVRAGIQKRFTPHLLRHSRITHLIQQGYSEVIIKKMMWGDINTTMFKTYVHLCDTDTDNEIFRQEGIISREESDCDAMALRQCHNCLAINAPTATFCMTCGQPLFEETRISLEAIMRDIEQTQEFKTIQNIVQQSIAQLV